MFALVGGLAFSTGTHGLRASAGPCVSRARTVTLAASRSAARSYGRPRRHGVLAGAQQEIDGKSGDSAPSVSGTVYSAGDDAPTVQLFTKAGCTLCDVAKGVLASASAERPHTLETVDITDEDKAEWWAKYKYDIPVLHINNVYWAKHRIELDATLQALADAKAGALEASKGEPDAEKMERK